jgi:hypothetical protein
MDEEHAIFVIGKRMSALRNSGEDLSEERIQVGGSWVLPDELADEYDKHYPPGPRRHKQATDRIFEYSMVPSRDCRGELMGLYIKHEGRAIDVLEKAAVLPCNFHGALSERTRTSKCNRYDVIQGRSNTFVIDKLEEKISVAKAQFRVDDTTFCEETPIAGSTTLLLDDSKSDFICSVSFPFFSFEKFWPAWNGYVEFRKRQIAELRITEQGVPPNDR